MIDKMTQLLKINLLNSNTKGRHVYYSREQSFLNI